jgi:hypothetical protein
VQSDDSSAEHSPAPSSFEAVFPLPNLCGDVTEMRGLLAALKDGFVQSEAARLFSFFDRHDTPCHELYDSLDAAYQDYIAYYQELTSSAARVPIEGPEPLVSLQRAYFASKVGAEDPRRAYQEGVAAINKLNAQIAKVPITGPIELWWLSDRYHRAKACYEQLLKQP